MGLQFGNSFGLSDELNKFSAVRRNEMAGRGCQSPRPPGFLRCIVDYVYCICLDCFPGCIGAAQTGLQALTGEENPEMLPHRVTLPSGGKKAKIPSPHEQLKSAAIRRPSDLSDIVISK